MSNGLAWQDALPRGTVIRGYSIRQVLGQGGFGIVYRARHLELGNVVAIKEYLPAELAVREGLSVRPRSTAYLELYQDGLRRFRNEGQALVALHSHSSIVSCRDFFRRNNTAYLVMEFEAGKPLSRVLRERESEGRPFSEKDLMDVAVPLLEGLERVHRAEIVHRDIKPANVLLREATGEPVLIDFGAAKQDVAGQTKSMAPRTPGYAAWEQIVPDGELGPWTDIYAVGMLLWRIVAGGSPGNVGKSPVPVELRINAFVRRTSDPVRPAAELGVGRFDPKVLAAIDRCLKLQYEERVQDCSELLGLLGLGCPRRSPRPAWKNSLRMEFVGVPAGNFVMGSPEDEEYHIANERQHAVRIRQGFWLGKYTVTQEEWQALMGTNPSQFKSCGPRCPVESVSWDLTQEYIRRLNKRESGRGYRYRLPTESEWEYAARSGTVGPRYGDLDSIAWYRANSGNRTHQVGQKQANAWGLHDMLGNVWEWTADWYGGYPYGSVTDPEGPERGSYLVVRGGSWGSKAGIVRSVYRHKNSPGFCGNSSGFRLVRTI